MALKGILENYFAAFRRNTIGYGRSFESPYGDKKLLYADWTATGRAYGPIEECIQTEIMPFLANTHTTGTTTGLLMTVAYEEAKVIIKQHVNADAGDALIFCGSGMTAAVNKLQRILGIRVPQRITEYLGDKNGCLQINEELKPVVFVTHMEHHSNHISWLETIATVEIIKAGANGNIDLEHFSSLLERFKHRTNMIAAITACSNVTGIRTPYHNIAKMIHRYGGVCFVDFACSAPYVKMDMHPAEKDCHLDAIYFSPHKFLGGPGTPGVLIFNKQLYHNQVPDQPGGGTILYSNPWKVHQYATAIELREDGGTPPILQGIKAAMCIRLKEEMGSENILQREKEMLTIVFDRLLKIEKVKVLEENVTDRLGIFSFRVMGAHHNLVVKIMNDRFGIQTRGGCSCAGTYGHALLNVDEAQSYQILGSIRSGNLSSKPGWIRLSLHPTMTDADLVFIMDAIELTVTRLQEWASDYIYCPKTNEYNFTGFEGKELARVKGWFNLTTLQKPVET